MKRYLFTSAFILFMFLSMTAQWSGTNPVYTTSQVGIGTTTPQKTLEVYSTGVPTIRIGSDDPSSNNTVLELGGYTTTCAKSAIISTPNTAGWFRQDLMFCLANGNNNNTVTSSDVAMTIKSYSLGGFGFVGIGTTSPNGKLHLASDNDMSLIISRASGNYATEFYRNASAGTVTWRSKLGDNSTWHNHITVGEGESSHANNRLILQEQGGNVGIGTTNPGEYKLNVSGRIRADEVVVNTTGADYVFESDYQLPTLTEVESFIKENRHLPDFVSADEMNEKGLNVSEMQTKMLQKIEELTLYVIEQNKKIQSLDKKVKELESEKIHKN